MGGNRTQEVSALPTDTLAGSANFTYDTADQLLTSQLPTQSAVSYAWDATHKRTTAGPATFTYLNNEALSAETPGSISYAPDADGKPDAGLRRPEAQVGLPRSAAAGQRFQRSHAAGELRRR